jgi:hypothetical protein
MLGWGVSTYDALYAMQAWATPHQGADGNFNFGKVSDAAGRADPEDQVRARRAQAQCAHPEALLRIRDEALFIPMHHQIRPWAMKPGWTPCIAPTTISKPATPPSNEAHDVQTLAAALLAVSLGASAASLRWAAQNDIQTLDPHSQNHSATTTITAMPMRA